MNCRQIRSLISAYLDQELTGQQMLEMHAHLAACSGCTQEWREVREMRRLLRALSPYRPPATAENRLAARLEQELTLGFAPVAALLRLLPALPALRWDQTPGHGSRPRGRRLASALALSSVAVLVVAAPFASSNGDAVGSAMRTPRVGPFQASLLPLPALQWYGGLLPAWHVPPRPEAAAPASAVSRQETPPAVGDIEAEPLHDDAVSGYTQGDVALSVYQVPNTGQRR